MVCSQCWPVIIFGRHRLGVFRSALTVTCFWPTLIRVFVADISKVFFFLLMSIIDIFWPTSVGTIFWSTIARFIC